MKQINSDQIVDNGIPDNTVKPIPRDLAEVKNSSANKSGLGFVNAGASNTSDGGPLPVQDGSTNPISMPPPDTPAFIGVKSQSVKIKDDGTYAIDIVIEVEDIRNVSDYEVRISKSAGSV